MSGGQASSMDAVEMKKIDPSQPSVPAKDDPIGTDESDTKGKEKEVASSSSNRQERTDSLSIGAADAPLTPNPAEDPACRITLLLPTGARHPYKIDHAYLTKRNVDVPEVTEHGKKDPFSISVYKLKELILREWRDEWDGKPASPSSIRLIHFGKLLDDKEPLKSKYNPQKFVSFETNLSVFIRLPIQLRKPQRCTHECETSRDARRRRGWQGQERQ